MSEPTTEESAAAYFRLMSDAKAECERLQGRLAKLEDGIRARAKVCEWRGEQLTAESLRDLLDGE